MHSRLWLDLDFHRGRPTLDKSLSHNRSLGNDRRRSHSRSVGYNDVVALPFAGANVERKTDHANQNNWQIAIFNDPLRQQTVRPHVRWKFSPIPIFTGKRNVLNQSRVPDVSREPVLIYRQRNFSSVR